MSCSNLNTLCGTGKIYVKFFHLHLIIWWYPQNPRNLTTSFQCSHPDCLRSSGGKCASSGRFPNPRLVDESDIGAGHDAADRPRRNEVDNDSDEVSLKDVDSNELSCKRRRRRPFWNLS